MNQDPSADARPENAPGASAPAVSGWQFTPPPVPREPISVAAGDGVAAVAVFAAAWFFLRLVTVPDPGLGVCLYTMGFVAMTLAYRQSAGLSMPRQSLPWLGVMVLSAASFALLDNGLIAYLNVIFLVVVTGYWLAVLSGTRVQDRLGEFLPADLCSQFFVVPFQNFECLASVCKRSVSRTRLGKDLAAALLALVCSLPIVGYVCYELAQVEAGFASCLRALLDVVSLENLLSVTTVLAIPLAFYLYGLLYGDQHRRYTGVFTPEKLERAAARRRVLPPAAVYTLLALLCLVYALFFLIGTVGLFSFLGESSLTPHDYSQFARKGFFELCRVSVVNLLVLWGVHLFLNTSSQRSAAPVRLFHIVLCCQTLLLIALALCKMGLYIRCCGVTWLRVCTSWFMVLLAVVFGLVLLAQFRPVPLARWIAVSFCVLFLALCYLDVGGLVVKSAVWRYENLGDASAFQDPWRLEPYALAGAPELRRLFLLESAKPDSPVASQLERLLNTAGEEADRRNDLVHWNLDLFLGPTRRSAP